MRIQPWNFVYLIGLVIYIAIRGVFGGRTKANEKVVSRVDWRDRALVGAVFIGNIVLPALYLFTPWLDWADYGGWKMEDRRWEMGWLAMIPWCGVVVMAIALW